MFAVGTDESFFGDLHLVPKGYQVVQITRGVVDKILWTACFE